MKQDMMVNVLGADWKIRFGNADNFPALKENAGYADSSVREIIVDDLSGSGDDPLNKKDVCALQKQVIRRELIHAFLAESGLDGNGFSAEHWEHNEEMIDWFAIQSPKIFKVFCELDLL